MSGDHQGNRMTFQIYPPRQRHIRQARANRTCSTKITQAHIPILASGETLNAARQRCAMLAWKVSTCNYKQASKQLLDHTHWIQTSAQNQRRTSPTRPEATLNGCTASPKINLGKPENPLTESLTILGVEREIQVAMSHNTRWNRLLNLAHPYQIYRFLSALSYSWFPVCSLWCPTCS